MRQTQSTVAEFDLWVWQGRDEVRLQTLNNADVCLELTNGSGTVRVGENATLAGSDVNLRTGQPCTCVTQPPPAAAVEANRGLHVWYDRCSGTFTMRATSTGRRIFIEGQVSATANLTITELIKLERRDDISGGGSSRIDFDLSLTTGVDEIQFTAPDNARVCLALDNGLSLIHI